MVRWAEADRDGDGRSLAGIYEPIWEYDAPTLYKDLSAHVLFGVVADGALRLIR